MLKKLRQSNKGFTIIEVLIVLAIAALILLIVFLAVPALQRNSRNTQRANDAAALLAAAAEFANNNNGTTPSTALTVPASGLGNVQFNGPASAVTTQAKVGYYNKGVAAGQAGPAGNTNQVLPAGTAIAARSTTAAEDWIAIGYGVQCNTAGNAAAAGSARSIAVVYQIESGRGTWASICKDS